MVSARKSSFDIRDVIDNKKILLVKLPKGLLVDSAHLLGSFLLNSFQLAAFSRAEIPEEKRQKFYLYIDEFQNYAAESFTDVLSEARKYKLPLIIAHQNLNQLPRDLRASILSNCWLQVFFQISREDAQLLAKEALTSLYTVPPGWEDYIQWMQRLPPQQCFIRNKVEGGVILNNCPTVPSPREHTKLSTEEFLEVVSAVNFGQVYLRSRKDIEADYQERRRALLGGDENGVETFKVTKTVSDNHSLRERIEKKWQKIMSCLEIGDEANLRVAVNDADALLDEVLKEVGYGGESIAQRLEQLPPDQVSNLDGLWDAHRLRNQVIHKGFHPETEDVQRAINAYEQALRDLGVFAAE